MAEFTTGEAVALQLPVARLPTRVAAFLIDLLVQLGLGWALMSSLAYLLLLSDAESVWFATAGLVCLVTVLVGYPVATETLSRGRTFGKLLIGLRVVRADGGPVDFRHCLTRGLAGAIVDFWMLGGFGAIAMITSLCSPNARRVGDVLAGTVVVHAQQQLPTPALAVPPPWLADWSARLDLAALPEDLALAIRQYLTRHRIMTPAAQHDIGTALVNAVCASLGAIAPAYPPVQILGSITAERQRRALAVVQPGLPQLAGPPGVLVAY
ncbi:RDD family protein [Nocardia donostiensis]|uniref:RDD family protein n=1 Tax=Nocardia donostiensis TaxID=1538463 RepID=A0A1W0AV52_9NOCA|nr:RDD family protein [Nocardia donostiensis]ONM49105.1 RDD family protein [Nocardia donostiensis]OQS14123.1 RDD family protein [Nocardia donostiensis]OQS19716.1 RDD family protein [Nocardia donostiensis]